jgi:hypothetical protein
MTPYELAEAACEAAEAGGDNDLVDDYEYMYALNIVGLLVDQLISYTDSQNVL